MTGEIKGDVDCDGAVNTVDALTGLRFVAGVDFTQGDPCTPVGAGIPAGELIPGPEGPPGPQGEPGISGYERVFDDTTSFAAQKSVVVNCPEGKQVLGGGGSVTGAVPDDVALVESYPLDESRWAVIAEKITGVGVQWTLRTHAICAFVAE